MGEDASDRQRAAPAASSSQKIGRDELIQIKRTYDPRRRSDGRRILVERLWPRGMSKAAVAADDWMKDVAPSTELRRWFAHQVDRWDEFQRRYRKELEAHPEAWGPILVASQKGPVTLLYSARDPMHNSAIVLGEFLTEQGARPGSGRARRPRPRTGAARTVREDAKR
jgi:uncharacterized protein YeaO (DUF488 family)